MRQKSLMIGCLLILLIALLFQITQATSEVQDNQIHQTLGSTQMPDNLSTYSAIQVGTSEQLKVSDYIKEDGQALQNDQTADTWSGSLNGSWSYSLNDSSNRSWDGSWKDNYCNTFNSVGYCVKCSYRYYKKYENEDSQIGCCSKVSDFCQTFSEVNGDCLSCYQGYGDPLEGKCLSKPINGNVRYYSQEQPEVDENCQCFTDYRACKSCYDGYYLDENRNCILNQVRRPETEHCVQYGYANLHNQSGEAHKHKLWNSRWVEGCQIVCKQCEEQYYLDQNYSCIEISRNCVTVGQDGKCLEYQENSQLNIIQAQSNSNQFNEEFDLNQYSELQQDSDNIAYQRQETVAGDPNDPDDSNDGDDHCVNYKYRNFEGKWYDKEFKGYQKICKQCEYNYQLNQNYQCQRDQSKRFFQQHSGSLEQDSVSLEQDPVSLEQDSVSSEQDPFDHCIDIEYLDKQGRWYPGWVSGCVQVCSQCQAQYYLNTDRQCILLPQNCLKVNNQTGICAQCQNNYQLNYQSNQCQFIMTISDSEDDHCLAYQYRNDNNFEGQYNNEPGKYQYQDKWTAGCKKVCKFCASGYKLSYEGQCQSEDITESIPNPYCQTFSENGNCQACAYRSIMKPNGICQKISDQCLTWNQTNAQCTTCYGGYLLTQGSCVAA